MPRLAANLTMLFTEFPFLDRFERAARAGFKGVEFLFPYAFAAHDIRARLDRFELQLVLHNLPAGDWAGGERGIACHPNRVEEFRAGVAKGIEYATALGCKQLNCLAGKAPEGVPEAELRRTFVENLRYAAPELAKAGIKLLAEPVNNRDIPGFYLNKSAQAISIMDEVGSDNLYLQYDFYHTQIMEGDLTTTFRRLKNRIAHVQIADNPGRNEPGTGEINYPFIFGMLDAEGYAGWVGCEYKPAAATTAGLGWFAPYARSAA